MKDTISFYPISSLQTLYVWCVVVMRKNMILVYKIYPKYGLFFIMFTIVEILLPFLTSGFIRNQWYIKQNELISV